MRPGGGSANAEREPATERRARNTRPARERRLVFRRQKPTLTCILESIVAADNRQTLSLNLSLRVGSCVRAGGGREAGVSMPLMVCSV